MVFLLKKGVFKKIIYDERKTSTEERLMVKEI